MAHMSAHISGTCPCQGDTLTRFVQPMILSILSRGPCHGYRMIQEIAYTRLWNQSIPDPAGIYRALREMERRGLISSQPGQRSSGVGRRSFCLTDQGAQCAEHWLDTLVQYQQGIGEVIAMLQVVGRADPTGIPPEAVTHPDGCRH